jgi:arsenite methyltransferase
MVDPVTLPGSTPKAAVAAPQWFAALLDRSSLSEGDRFESRGEPLVVRGGIVRSQSLVSQAQQQTARAFGFKWQKRDTFESTESLARMRAWLVERYGSVTDEEWFPNERMGPVVLDAGCGAAMSAIELFGPKLDSIRYLGVDVSEAVDVARARFAERGIDAAFAQVDLLRIPLPDQSVDMIFSEGVLHHTDSTERALKSLVRLLKVGGRFLFYVYRTKGPIREFVDDHIRHQLQAMTPEQAWNAVLPLTRLGKALGELGVSVDVPEDVSLLRIPAGRYDVQRLFYWHVFKAFYDPAMTLEEMNHINFDWYAPMNAHRQTPEQVRSWCVEAGLVVERENLQQAGITVIARRVR